jgi:hypothetical protein
MRWGSSRGVPGTPMVVLWIISLLSAETTQDQLKLESRGACREDQDAAMRVGCVDVMLSVRKKGLRATQAGGDRGTAGAKTGASWQLFLMSCLAPTNTARRPQLLHQRRICLIAHLSPASTVVPISIHSALDDSVLRPESIDPPVAPSPECRTRESTRTQPR